MDNTTSPAAQGEYRGDFTRDTFEPLKHFSRVLMQQGRVQLDADWNEQVSILLHLARTLAADMLGPHAGAKDAFAIQPVITAGELTDLKIQPGHYYVDGLLCENELGETTDGNVVLHSYYDQPYLAPDHEDAEEKLPDPPFLVYLDVWERHVTDVEQPEIREVALGGPDTATRAQVVWQVRVYQPKAGETLDEAVLKKDDQWAAFTTRWQPDANGMLSAWAAKLDDPTAVEPCAIPPSAGYRGPENQLYRVEIHTGGDSKHATFKWSRNNGTDLYPVTKVSGNELELEHLGRDGRSAPAKDDWVELVNPKDALWGRSGTLYRIVEVDRERLAVQVHQDVAVKEQEGLLLRRWDHKAATTAADGAVPVGDGAEIEVEQGIKLRFVSGAQYAQSSYWLIPARTEIRDILWKRTSSEPDPAKAAMLQTPHGPAHHFAPLALVKSVTAAAVSLRREINRPQIVKAT